jgi:dihydrofolate reductase
MKFIGVVCTNYNNAIGYRGTNSLIYSIKGDLSRFKTLTTSSFNGKPNVLLMGMNTWNSLPKKPLENRLNCVVSHNAQYYNRIYDTHINRNLEFFHSIPQCLFSLESRKNYFNNCFIIGGSSIYDYFIRYNILDYIYETHIETPNKKGDIYFTTGQNCFNNYASLQKLGYELMETNLFKSVESLDVAKNKKVLLDYTENIYQNNSKNL